MADSHTTAARAWPDSRKEALQVIFEAQAIFEALAADAKLRQFHEDCSEERGEGMLPVAAETLARRGWQLLESLPDWPEEEEAKEEKAPDPGATPGEKSGH